MEVALVFNLKKKIENKPADYFSEFDSLDTINAIKRALESKGHQVTPVELNKDILGYFKRHKFDLVFNIAEGNGTRLRESELPAILDLLGIPYTGSSAFTLALALDKAMTKKVLRYDNIPTPNFQVFLTGKEELNPCLNFPLIVKPNREGSAKGISASSVVCDKKSLFERIENVIYNYKQEALVEEFIQGKELTVGILENGVFNVLPILEIDFSTCSKNSGEYFYSWRMKEFQGNIPLGLTPTFYCPARLSQEVERRVKEIALKAHKSLNCWGVSRTDIRLNKDDIPYVLEVNPLPGLDPQESNLPMIAKAAGIEYEELIEAILQTAKDKEVF
jgi:D-alanine-D-alanine ligase